MGDEQKAGGGSFWTSLPGVLTGLAALVGALGALYLNVRPKAEASQQAPQAVVKTYADELHIVSITPASGTQLKQEPTSFKMTAHYSLGAADTAMLAVVAARYPQQAGGCKGGWQADGVVRIPVKKGENDINVEVPWQAGRGHEGREPEAGYVGIAARYLTDSMVELKRLGPFPGFCFPVIAEGEKAAVPGNEDKVAGTGRGRRH